MLDHIGSQIWIHKGLNNFWRFWIMERRPISQLTWDPRELYWKVLVQAQIKHLPFFQYFVKIGKKILGDRSWKETTTNVFWRWNGLSPQHLKHFCKMVVRYKNEQENCLRLLVHRAISINSWRKWTNATNICHSCRNVLETTNIVFGVVTLLWKYGKEL